ncbi:hypothetical protein AAVH_34277, partial [Aphelenchoides avenae]
CEGTDHWYGFVPNARHTVQLLTLLFEERNAFIVDATPCLTVPAIIERFLRQTVPFPTPNRITILHCQEWSWPDIAHFIEPCPRCFDLRMRLSGEFPEGYAYETYHFDNDATRQRLTATVKIGCSHVWNHFTRQWKSCTSRKQVTEVLLEMGLPVSCRRESPSPQRPPTSLSDDVLREILLFSKRTDVETSQLSSGRLNDVVRSSPFAMPLRRILAAVETFRAMAIYHAPLEEGACGRVVHYSLETDDLHFPLRNCFVHFMGSCPIDDDKQSSAVYRLLSALPDDYVQLKIHTFGVKNLFPLQNPDRTYDERFSTFDTIHTRFNPTNYGVQIYVSDGADEFDVLQLEVMRRNSLRLWVKGHHDDVAKYAATANDAWKHYLFNASSRFLSVVNWLSAEDVEERSPFDVDGMLK